MKPKFTLLEKYFPLFCGKKIEMYTVLFSGVGVGEGSGVRLGEGAEGVEGGDVEGLGDGDGMGSGEGWGVPIA